MSGSSPPLKLMPPVSNSRANSSRPAARKHCMEAPRESSSVPSMSNRTSIRAILAGARPRSVALHRREEGRRVRVLREEAVGQRLHEGHEVRLLLVAQAEVADHAALLR